MSDLATFQHAFEIEGNPASVSVSPCSWMYPHYGLQVDVKVAGGHVFFHNKALSFKDATEADVIALASQTKLRPCIKCGKAALDDPTSYRGKECKGRCEACFTAALMAAIVADQKVCEERSAVADRKQAAKGFKYKTVAWVHPKMGDDYQISWYSVTSPTAAEVATVLKARRSEITTDYSTAAI